MEIFAFTLNAIGPIVLLILLGYGLKRIRLLDKNFLKTGNGLVFRVLLPVLLFHNVYEIEDLQAVDWKLIGYVMIMIVVLFLLGMITVHFFVPDARQKGVILQCVYRSNYAIIGLPLAASLGDEKSVAFAAVLSAFSIPLFNVFAVIALSMYTQGEDEKVNWKKVLHNIVTNPLIVAIGLGLVILAIRSFIPRGEDGTLVMSIKGTFPVIYKVIQDLAKIASPLALIIMGGLFEFQAVGRMYRQILLGSLWRTVISPAIGLGVAILLTQTVSWFSFTQVEYPALIALFSTPVAVSSAIMAGEMNNDDQLASQLVVWTSLASMGTIFVIIVVMRYFGWI